MGHSMAHHLLKAGYPVCVHTRTRSRAEALLAAGARWMDTPAHVAAESDVVFSMVGNPSDVESVHLGPAGTLRAGRLPRAIVDMTTSSPALAVTVAREAAALGVASVDAPVSGGDVGARNATLSIMCGGAPHDFESVKPLLECMGKTIELQGGPGAGQSAKLVNQILIAGTMLGIGEGMAFARKAGLDIERVLRSVSGGAAGSWALANLAPRAVRGDFSAGFFIEHFVKDLRLALDESARLGLDPSMTQLAAETYSRLVSQGHGRAGTQSIVHAYA